MRDHSMRMTTATLHQDELRIEGLNTLRKIDADPKKVQTTSISEPIPNQVELKKINASTYYFRLPTFNHHVKSKVDSLLQENHDLIADTPNLILDVRDNGGGSDVTYADLIQYVYTNKITVVNNSIWSSPDNIQKFENILNDPEYPGAGKGYIRGLIKELKANPNTFVRKDDNVIRKLRALPEPRNVIILMNRGCASSCEEFVLAARQSKKVTLMGENTMGVLDYANVHHLALPCESWGLQYATSRTNRLPDFPIDNIGIEPNVRIPEEKNWVEFAVEYLKTR
jgi:C-terminal processing protease CtpA/Prc